MSMEDWRPTILSVVPRAIPAPRLMMRPICQFAFTAASVLAAATSLVAQMPAPVAEKVTVTATIEAIDKSARLLMLKGEKGNVVAVQAGEQVKRFNELKVGDKVSATYTESVAVSVRQPGQPAPTSSSGVTTSTGAPGATAAARDTITVTVLSVDKVHQSVSVKRKDGSEVSMRVENPKYLEAVKAGDTVDITYTRALLLEVAPVK